MKYKRGPHCRTRFSFNRVASVAAMQEQAFISRKNVAVRTLVPAFSEENPERVATNRRFKRL
jgi:hypothetical protein